MEKVKLFLVLFGIIFFLFACKSKPEKEEIILTEFEQECVNVVDSVIAAINRRDMDGFLELLTDSVKFYLYRDRFYGAGKEKMKELFHCTIFQTPQINGWTTNRIVFNNKVIDRQIVKAFADRIEMNYVCIYIVENGKVDEFNYFYY